MKCPSDFERAEPSTRRDISATSNCARSNELQLQAKDVAKIEKRQQKTPLPKTNLNNSTLRKPKRRQLSAIQFRHQLVTLQYSDSTRDREANRNLRAPSAKSKGWPCNRSPPFHSPFLGCCVRCDREPVCLGPSTDETSRTELRTHLPAFLPFCACTLRTI